MSQQHDDEGTLIQPRTLAPAGSPGVTSPRQPGEAGPSDSAEDGLSLPIGARVGEFEITRRIGDGGFSIVYLARDHSLDRTVALKEYMPSSLATRIGATQVQPRSQRCRDTFEAGLKSFVNEAKLLAQFDHPALVKVYRFWEAHGTAYMVMPFYQGVTVKDAVRAMPEPPGEAWLMTLLAPLTEALMVIHAERCYHRDVAPDNVILLASSSKPLLLDFGAARRVIGDMTQGLTVILKAGYAPVEQYAEIPGMKQGPWTDVYALAAVVYWAITGSTPPASVGRMMSDSFVPLAKCAAGRYSMRFLQTIDRALVVLPERRTQTIAALRQELGLTGEGAAPPPPPTQWQDSEATVIRPAGHKSGPATVARRELPDVPVDPPTATRQPTTVASSVPPVRTGAQHGARTRRTVVVVSALGAAAAGAAIWWALHKPSAESSRPAPAGTNAIAADPQPAARQGVADTPAVPEAVASAPSASPSISEIPPKVPSEAVTEAAKPIPVAPTSPAEMPPDAPPKRVAKKVTLPDTSAAQPDQYPARASQRSDATKPERAQTDAANRAECGRILQRLSLGESSPELLERLKLLKCR